MMSIKPVDLQTLFMQMNQVGKEQALGKEAQVQGQDHEIAKMLQEEDQRDHSINKAEEAGDEANKVKGEKEHGGEYAETDEKGSKHKESTEHESEAEVLQDPNLGRHIDLSG
jgi:hypothetical protein